MDDRVIFHPTPINMRLSEEKLAALVKELGHDLASGKIFIFFNRERDRCKIARHDGEAFTTLEKVLAKGTFAPDEKIRIKPSAVHNFL